MGDTPTKVCSKCGGEFPATPEYFYKDKTAKYGLERRCKPCCVEYHKNWRNENIDKHRDYARQYAKEHIRRYSSLNGIWQKVNREKRNLSVRLYKKRHPIQAKIDSSRRRARINESTEHFTAADLELQYRSQRGKCWHCGIELNGNYQPDHLTSLKQGGSNAPDNIVCSCAPCNASKGAKTVAQWKGRLF